MTFTTAKILENRKLKVNFWQINLNCPEIAKEINPGQFVLIRVHPVRSGQLSNGVSSDPLLPRPFGVFSINKAKGNFSVLYAVKGKGTELLTQRKTGEILYLSGPHGNGFKINPKSTHSTSLSSSLVPLRSPLEVSDLGVKDRVLKTICLVAGGFGVAPLLGLAQDNKKKKIITIIGGRTKDLVLFEKEFKNLGAEVYVCTNDGSCGKKGVVTDILSDLINKEKIDEIFSVGPLPMLKAVSKLSSKYKIPCQISLEERMACGIGACKGCVAKINKEYKPICNCGPIFNSREVNFD